MNVNDHTQETCSEAEVFAIQAIISSHGKFSFKVNKWLKTKQTGLNFLDTVYKPQTGVNLFSFLFHQVVLWNTLMGNGYFWYVSGILCRRGK